MLLLSEAALALLSVNPAGTFWLMLSATVTAAFYVWVLRHRFKHRATGIIAKIFAVLMIAFAALLMTLHAHLLAVLFILGMIWCIFIYTSLFAKRNGLIKNNIREARQFATHLKEGAKAIVLGGEFRLQQANIYALGAAGAYPKTDEIARDYRLDLMPVVTNLL